MDRESILNRAKEAKTPLDIQPSGSQLNDNVHPPKSSAAISVNCLNSLAIHCQFNSRWNADIVAGPKELGDSSPWRPICSYNLLDGSLFGSLFLPRSPSSLSLLHGPSTSPSNNSLHMGFVTATANCASSWSLNSSHLFRLPGARVVGSPFRIQSIDLVGRPLIRRCTWLDGQVAHFWFFHERRLFHSSLTLYLSIPLPHMFYSLLAATQNSNESNIHYSYSRVTKSQSKHRLITFSSYNVQHAILLASDSVVGLRIFGGGLSCQVGVKSWWISQALIHILSSSIFSLFAVE